MGDEPDAIETGDRITAIIDRVSGKGNGIINLPGGSHINLGPIKKEAVGEQTRVRILSSNWGKCLSPEYIDEAAIPDAIKTTTFTET